MSHPRTSARSGMEIYNDLNILHEYLSHLPDSEMKKEPYIRAKQTLEKEYEFNRPFPSLRDTRLNMVMPELERQVIEVLGGRYREIVDNQKARVAAELARYQAEQAKARAIEVKPSVAAKKVEEIKSDPRELLERKPADEKEALRYVQLAYDQRKTNDKMPHLLSAALLSVDATDYVLRSTLHAKLNSTQIFWIYAGHMYNPVFHNILRLRPRLANGLTGDIQSGVLLPYVLKWAEISSQIRKSFMVELERNSEMNSIYNAQVDKEKEKESLMQREGESRERMAPSGAAAGAVAKSPTPAGAAAGGGGVVRAPNPHAFMPAPPVSAAAARFLQSVHDAFVPAVGMTVILERKGLDSADVLEEFRSPIGSVLLQGEVVAIHTANPSGTVSTKYYGKEEYEAFAKSRPGINPYTAVPFKSNERVESATGSYRTKLLGVIQAQLMQKEGMPQSQVAVELAALKDSLFKAIPGLRL